MVKAIDLLRQNRVSASELRQIRPDWPEVLIEDYLNIFNDILSISEITDESTSETQDRRQEISGLISSGNKIRSMSVSISKNLDELESRVESLSIKSNRVGKILNGIIKRIDDINNISVSSLNRSNIYKLSAISKRIDDLEQIINSKR